MSRAHQALEVLRWYRAHARDLPWRRDPRPYHILLSELMCQQTRVATALPYYEAFLERWPTLDDLAAADLDDVLQAWAGLGYYRRARALHAAVQAAAARGGLPAEAEALRDLPGIGPYTAGAIASIAFRQKAPAVDGNVERVMSRVDRSPEAPWSAAGKRALHAAVASLHEALPADAHPGDLTQGLMELGATVCTPRAPACEACPLAPACAARATGEVDAWPRRRERTPPRPIEAIAGLAQVDGLPLLARRSGKGLLGGLWEPVRAPVDATRAGEEALVEAYAALGLAARIGVPLGTVEHVFSHRRLTLRVHRVAVDGIPRPGGDYDRVEAIAPEAVGLSRLAEKALALDRPLALFAAEAVSR